MSYSVLSARKGDRMSKKRRDCKGRILRVGESQRQDGRYMYKYNDAAGKTHYLYSWKLEAIDKLPAGKPDECSLREKIKTLKRDLEAGITPDGGRTSVYDLVLAYIDQKTGVRYKTRINYKFILNVIRKEPFGRKPISSVRLSDAKGWFIKLQRDGRGYSTIHAIRGVIRPAFQMAVDDDLIRKNPFAFSMNTVVFNDSVTRTALTHSQEKALLDFVKNDAHCSRYYDGICILFRTGMRISEFTGLTIRDIDMKKRRININCQLQRMRDMQYIVEEPKTEAGNRILPMSDEVYACFRRILEARQLPQMEPTIGGKCGFLYLDKNGMPMVALHWEHYFKRICEKYNSTHRIPLPKVTPHVCRHTYCSNMVKLGMNPKSLQYLMGHSDVGVTLNTYTHLDYEDVEAEWLRVQQ